MQVLNYCWETSRATARVARTIDVYRVKHAISGIVGATLAVALEAYNNLCTSLFISA